MATNLDLTMSLPRLTKHQTKRCNTLAENIDEYYRRSIFIPWIDSLLNSLSDRFLKHKTLLISFKCLFPTSNIRQLNKYKVLNIFMNFMRMIC